MKISRSVLVGFFALIAVHMAVSTVMSLTAQSPYFSAYHNGHGLWNFAPDSIAYDRKAKALAREGGANEQLGSTNQRHVWLIALSYRLFSPKPLSFAPVNAVVWGLSLLCIFFIARTMTKCSDKTAIQIALVYGFWPSGLLLSTQLMKDPFYNLGCLLLLFGWVSLLAGRRGFGFPVAVSAGFALSLLIRSDSMPLLLIISILAVCIIAVSVREALPFGLLAMGMIVLVLIFDAGMAGNEGNKAKAPSYAEEEEIASPKEELKKILKGAYNDRADKLVTKWLSDDEYATSVSGGDKYHILVSLAKVHQEKFIAFLERQMERWEFREWIPFAVEAQLVNAASYRERLLTYYIDSSSNVIDADILFRDIYDVIAYLPRGVQIALFAPFPNRWIEKGNTGGESVRLLGGIEMCFWYILYTGFVYFLLKSQVGLPIKIWVVLFVLVLIIPIGLFIPNVGTLFRMRHVYLVPMLIGGLAGWKLFAGRHMAENR